MVDDLNQSAIINAHFLDLVRTITRGGHSSAVLSAGEQRLLQRADEVRALHGDMDGDLVAFLGKVRPVATHQDTLAFLLGARSQDRLPNAINALEMACDEGINVKGKDLRAMLNDPVPLEWQVHAMGEERAQDEAREAKPSLDMQRLRDFKI